MNPKNRSSNSYLSPVIVSLLFLPFTLSAQVTAVEFGGDYNGSNSNALTTGYTLENGDFDAEADSADRRGFIAFGTLFRNINDANGVGNNNVIYHGTQHTHLDSTVADPAIGIFRFQKDAAAADDALQCGHGGTTAVTQQTFAPHVIKSDFLNGADSSGTLLFEDAADSVTFSLTQKAGANTVNRALVKSSGNWYVSTSTSASDTLLSINGFTEMWIPYAPDTNIYLSATTLAGTAVSGSTLTDIQAFGAVIQQNDIASGRALNADRFSVTGFSARMVITPPPIIVVNTDFGVVPDTGSPPSPLETNPHTISFDAGATADKLIVALSSEVGGPGPAVITYNGDPLMLVPDTTTSRTKGIWYLDNPFTGGAADLVIDMTSYTTVNGIGFGVVSLSGSAPGVSGGIAAAGLEVSLSAPVDGSFIMSAYGSNAGNTPTVPVGHTQLYTSGDIGSADGAAAFLNNADAGSQTVTYAQGGTPSANSTCAAVFLPTPGGETFADWIGGFPGVGGDDGLDDDPDGDGVENGVENFFGTAPDVFSEGLVLGTVSGTISTFTHPQSAAPASDLTASYRWSTNLVDWYDGDNVDGPGGLTVDIVADPVGPPSTTVTVTASGAVPKLFLRVEVN